MIQANQTGKNSPLVARLMQHANMTTIFRAETPPVYSSSPLTRPAGQAEKAIALPPQTAWPEPGTAAVEEMETGPQWSLPSASPGAAVSAVQAKPMSEPRRDTQAVEAAKQGLPSIIQPRQTRQEKAAGQPGKASSPAPIQLQPGVSRPQPTTPVVKSPALAEQPAPPQEPSAAAVPPDSTPAAQPPVVQRQAASESVTAETLPPEAAPETAENVEQEAPQESLPEPSFTKEERADRRLHTIMRLHQEKAAREAAPAVEEAGSNAVEMPPNAPVQRQVETPPEPIAEKAADPEPKTLPSVPLPRKPRPETHPIRSAATGSIQAGKETPPVQRSSEPVPTQISKRPDVEAAPEAGGEEKQTEAAAQNVTAQPETVVDAGVVQTVMPSTEAAQQVDTLVEGEAVTEISAHHDMAPNPIQQQPVETLPGTKTPEKMAMTRPDSAAEAGTRLAKDDSVTPVLPDAETMEIPAEAVTGSEQAAGQFVSADTPTVQPPPSNQPIQLAPEMADEPTMIVENRPLTVAQTQESDSLLSEAQESHLPEREAYSGDAHLGDTHLSDTHASVSQTLQTTTPQQVTKPLQRTPETAATAAPETAAVPSSDEPQSGVPLHHQPKPPPLQDVWPVKVLSQPQPTPQRTSAAVPPLHSLSPRPATGELRRKLAAIPTAKPSESSVAVMQPRQPRQIQRALDVRTEKSQTVTTGTPAGTVQPERPAPELLSDQRTVQTQIGDLPADLWTLIGQKPPLSSPGDSDRGQKKGAETAEADSTVIQKAEDTTPSFTQPAPIQRLEAPPPAVPEAGAAEEGAAEGGEKGEAEIDVDDLALQVFSQLKKRLSVEWERGRGRYGYEW